MGEVRFTGNEIPVGGIDEGPYIFANDLPIGLNRRSGIIVAVDRSPRIGW